MVALAPNVPAHRRALDTQLAKHAGALRRRNEPLERQKVPWQIDLYATDTKHED